MKFPYLVLVLSLACAASAVAQQNPLGGGGQNPLGGGGQNPLARKPAWVGAFTDGNVTLSLEQGQRDRFSGSLTVGGQTFPVQGTQAGGAQFTGAFTVGADSFAFQATLQGDTLTLVSDGNTYTLARDKPAASANPLAGGGKAPAAGAPSQAGQSELGDVDAGPVTAFKHSSGWLAFGIPQGWRVQGEEPGTIVFDPGYQQGGILEAVVIARFGDLEPDERGQSVGQLLRASTPELKQELAGEMGIQITKAGEPRELEVGGQPAAFFEWEGVQQQDGMGVTVWLGGLANGGRFFTVIAIVQKGRESAYLPKARRILVSARVSAPKPGEVSLAGREVFHTSNSSSGSFSTTYQFQPGGQVHKTSYFSAAGLGGGANTEDTGTYSVSGTTVSMQFQDGAEQGTIVVENGQLVGVRFGNAVYHLRR